MDTDLQAPLARRYVRTMERPGYETAALHKDCERGDYTEALAHLKVWAGMLGTYGSHAPRHYFPATVC
jgi:hypothetical protein